MSPDTRRLINYWWHFIGGISNVETGAINYAIKISGGLSLPTMHDINAEVIGMDAFRPDRQPNVLVYRLPDHIAGRRGADGDARAGRGTKWRLDDY